MQDLMTEEKTLDQNNSFGVVVVGGGVSGTAAALVSARSGVRTLLIERDTYLGGIGYTGLLQHICGLYPNGETFPTGTLNQGIVQEIIAHLAKLSPQKMIKKMGLVYVLPYFRRDLLSVFDSLCGNERDLTVLRATTVLSVEKANTEITGLVINRSHTAYKIFPRVVIDCSGDGVVSEMAGASFELLPQEQLQMSACTVHLKGIQDRDELLAIKVSYYLSDGVRKHILPPLLRFSTFTPGDSPDEGYLKVNVSGLQSKDRDKKAFEYASAVHHYLSNMIPVLKGSYLAGSSMRVVDREGRRVLGEYILTGDDVIHARKFDDGIAKGAWPIELWDMHKGPVYRYVRSGDYYEIPLRSLKVKGIPNLFVAGRCISASHEALGSTRVMGTCMTLGEQAGIAASFRVRNSMYSRYGNESLHTSL